jgi:hypothetical protein
VPEIVGAFVFAGADPLAATTAVGAEVADPSPPGLLAVTATRSRCPTSKDETV